MAEHPVVGEDGEGRVRTGMDAPRAQVVDISPRRAGAKRAWAASAGRIAVLASVLTPALIALVAYERASAVDQAAAVAAVPRYDALAGISTLRREAVVELPARGRPATCAYVSAPGRRVVCPAGFGAIEGSCADAGPGDLLVTWSGTGWLCPVPHPGAAGSRTASVLCCK